MDKEVRSAIERATQRARKLLEDDYIEQLEGTYDVLRDGKVPENGGRHLNVKARFHRDKIIAAVEHKKAAGMKPAEALLDYLRDAAFTTLNRFVALKMLEARDLVQPCISRGEQSAGYKEFGTLAAGVSALPGGDGYQLFLECIFDELSTEIKVLFDRRDVASVIWPRRRAFEQLLEVLNAAELSGVWGEDETIGWVYQYFNSGEERRAMRDASQAPRNSRELAIRNQFFTPRYVVQFLTDNTLGRLWYEMRNGETALKDRCKYMVQRLDNICPSRTKKDPRDIKVLDPACGSGHFLIYAFDLLVEIYQEAHQDVDGPKSEATGQTLAADYPSVEALRVAVPALILAQNLHGVDIDPRCVQIAQLALWMRAQRAFRDLQVGRGERPLIRRSNIVVAEPLATDDRTLKDFVVALGDPELGRLFTELVDILKLGGELGLLLRLEDQVGRVPKHGQTAALFTPPEARIRAALSRFLAASSSVRRRLFVDDAAQGVGLLELAEQRFDVALMNPPFGLTSERAYAYMESKYPGSHNDIFATFVARSLELTTNGFVAAITSRAFLVAPRMEEFRRRQFLPRAELLADLGLAVMDDAFVESCAYILNAGGAAKHSELMAFDLRTTEGKEGGMKNWPKPFCADRNLLEKVPKARILYSLPKQIFTLLRSTHRFEPTVGTAREGMKTFDNPRFLRLRWEVNPSDVGFANSFTWTFLAKGGAFAFYLGTTNVVVNWGLGGRELQEINIQKNGSTAQVRQASTYWGRAGLTFSGRSAKGFSARALPAGHVISGRGPAILSESDVSNEYLLGWVNSRLIRSLIHLQASASYFATGIIKQLPWVALDRAGVSNALAATRATLRALLKASSLNELSPYFVGPAVRLLPADGLAEARAVLEKARAATEEAMALWDVAVDDAYGIRSDTWATDLLQPDASDEDDEDAEGADVDAAISEQQYAHGLVSYAVGCAFGRWDLTDLGRRDELLSSVSVFGDLNSLGLGTRPSAREPHCFVDDPGDRADLVERVERVLNRLVGGGSGLTDWVGARLGTGDVRKYFRGRPHSFFSAHCDDYSRSRRKAPIYWQLATPSASFSVWFYVHAFTRDALYIAQREHIEPKLRHEDQKLVSLRQEFGTSPTASQRKELATHEMFVEELRGFLDEVKRVAPLWNPSLDDGVIINFALLWRLVPHHKPWQKELKTTWDALCNEEYDWAHLAMHLWPERVVPKCAEDRSLAIAHGLEEVFWIEGSDGKWKARSKPPRSLEELVKERTSPAVKAALKGLLEAPAASVPTKTAPKKAASGRRKAKEAES